MFCFIHDFDLCSNPTLPKSNKYMLGSRKFEFLSQIRMTRSHLIISPTSFYNINDVTKTFVYTYYLPHVFYNINDVTKTFVLSQGTCYNSLLTDCQNNQGMLVDFLFVNKSNKNNINITYSFSICIQNSCWYKSSQFTITHVYDNFYFRVLLQYVVFYSSIQ